MTETRRNRAATKGRKRHSFLVDLAIRVLKEKPLGTVGAFVILMLGITAIFADQMAPYPPNLIVLADHLAPPSLAHPLGADNLGRDLLSRIIHGARISLYVGFGAAAIDLVTATIIGTISAYFGGKTDIIIQRFVDAWMCFPSLFIYLSVMAILGPGLTQVILVLGIHGGINGSRMIRSAVISIKENVYLEAARAIGAPSSRILTRHIVPNIMGIMTIMFSNDIARKILNEATLSFLGFGIPPPAPSWGGMLSGSGRTYMLQAPWMALWPGLSLAIVVYGVAMLGDALRDLLDPRLRGGLGRYSGVKRKMPKAESNA